VPTIKTGPMTFAEIQAIWESSVDPAYREPFETAGEGNGFEAWTQLFAQFERASKAIDVTTQAMFISPWSGQSNPPAAGAAQAIVQLTFQRTGLLQSELVLGKGLVFVQEQTTDSDVDGPVTVLTGRRYTLLDDLVFNPGEQGPFTVMAEAVKPGYGYNNPRPGTLAEIDQPGSGFNNQHATVLPIPQPAVLNAPASRVRLITINQPDMFVPDHIGQYVAFVTGSNQGAIARMVAFGAPRPDLVPQQGSSVDLELFYSLLLSPTAGTFAEGEPVKIGAGTGYLRVVGSGYDPAKKRLAVVLSNGTAPVIGDTLLGLASGATGTVQAVLSNTDLVAEAPIAGIGGAQWRVLDWVADWGLTVTNVASPTGGLAPFLDELGAERAIGRAPGESDDSYRERVKQIADVVTPNAIRRALNRTLGGLPWCFREVGSSFLPGVYYDGDLSPAGGPSNSSLASANQECSYDEDVFVLTGVVASGSFVFQPGISHRVVLETPDNTLYATGWFGSLTGGVTMVFVRTHGSIPSPIPAGLRVRVVDTGALFTVASGIVPASVNGRRFRVYLDYTQFRAFFLVGVPRLDLDDFGFAYDAGADDAYDAQPFSAFYDGEPLGDAAVYLRVYYAVNAARAGGVGFELYMEDVGCP
jgi:hypothetical protein